MKNMLKNIYSRLRILSPFVYYLIQYKRAAIKLGRTGGSVQYKRIFEEFIESCESKSCLQIGVKDNVGKKYGPNWVSVDKFDMRDFIDYHYDIHDLPFENESFDAVVCISILEHVPYPLKAISELKRVLKPGGKIWVQLPWLYPYHEAPKDYWRASPDGLRIWMEDFKEISCGIDLWDKTYFSIATYFYGEK
ncbi:class I SAM-dependent methyltransferase [Nitrosomonas sp.]|uniref:class I SAM-dependent methyltransferase n=1 Tax=Nitrosomonas sp. TaxID=42353 RepID=UPI002630DB0D|nr:class I SAM-dependent methyltransferase [Nitrosomonas sp.]